MTPNPPINLRNARIALLLTISLLVFTAGCGLVGAIYGALIDPLIPGPTVATEHDMTTHRVLIWVEDRSQGPQNPVLRRELTTQLRQELLDHQATTDIIDYQQIANFRNQHPDFTGMSLAQLGSHLNADQVLHVTIDAFRLHHQAGKDFYHASLTTFSHVIEVPSGKHLWPATLGTRPLTTTDDITQGQGADFENRLIRKISQEQAQQLSRAFYEHTLPKRSQCSNLS